MLETFHYFFQILGWLALFGLLLGMVRPVTVLWFLPKCNRRLVLKYYGVAALFLLSLSYGMGFSL